MSGMPSPFRSATPMLSSTSCMLPTNGDSSYARLESKSQWRLWKRANILAQSARAALFPLGWPLAIG